MKNIFYFYKYFLKKQTYPETVQWNYSRLTLYIDTILDSFEQMIWWNKEAEIITYVPEKEVASYKETNVVNCDKSSWNIYQ